MDLTKMITDAMAEFMKYVNPMLCGFTMAGMEVIKKIVKAIMPDKLEALYLDVTLQAITVCVALAIGLLKMHLSFEISLASGLFASGVYKIIFNKLLGENNSTPPIAPK